MYSPKISEEIIPKLYKISKARRTHMTTLVNEILVAAIETIQVQETVVVESMETENRRIIYTLSE